MKLVDFQSEIGCEGIAINRGGTDPVKAGMKLDVAAATSGDQMNLRLQFEERAFLGTYPLKYNASCTINQPLTHSFQAGPLYFAVTRAHGPVRAVAYKDPASSTGVDVVITAEWP